MSGNAPHAAAYAQVVHTQKQQLDLAALHIEVALVGSIELLGPLLLIRHLTSAQSHGDNGGRSVGAWLTTWAQEHRQEGERHSTGECGGDGYQTAPQKTLRGGRFPRKGEWRSLVQPPNVRERGPLSPPSSRWTAPRRTRRNTRHRRTTFSPIPL